MPYNLMFVYSAMLSGNVSHINSFVTNKSATIFITVSPHIQYEIALGQE